ncbi:hypothetical protein DIURU_000366 [Diutina rugosa]|uniref:Arrestin C-terminal-like domain-containing protein n=1 Tax=Diutina rugosa TaxID=5481 RepID=A0A642UYR7_DIURU|nr:uncharacterized protein DIURU_000366 [Diutina rugosa]KAA8907956.1 hypothetical protein DIURU_000366 [Diutina rugosa]
MTNYFDKFRSRVRRQSEPAVPSEPPLPPTTSAFSDRAPSSSTASSASPERPRRSSIAMISEVKHKIHRARAVSLGSSDQPTRRLVHDQTSEVAHRKLSGILADLGLQDPLVVSASSASSSSASASAVQFAVANTHDVVFVAPASSSSFTYEDEDGGGGASSQAPSSPALSPAASPALSPTSPTSSPPPPGDEPSFAERFCTFTSPNYLCTKIDSDTPIPHTFAVMVELDRRQRDVKPLEVDLTSEVTTCWPTSDGHSTIERFSIGALRWRCSFAQPDYFISYANSHSAAATGAGSGSRHALAAHELASRSRPYRLAPVRSSAAGESPASERVGPSEVAPSAEPGIYVFLLPVLLPPHMPASIATANGHLAHKLAAKFSSGGHVTTIDYPVSVARLPPSNATSVADKPIFVNRVWNDSLHYFITFPRKYAALGSEHTINIKLIPMVKDVIIKRIKVNVLERITYVSRDLTKEYDYDGDDPSGFNAMFSHRTSNKTRERVVGLCEVKTKSKRSTTTTPQPFRNQVVKCPDNNLLHSCYEPERKRSGAATGGVVATPLDINVALPFPTSPLDAANISGRQPAKEGITRALYPDSNFRHIQIHHRLQVCFRISKPDASDGGRMHHYEVVVDTPLILLSAKCHDDSMQLPCYHEIDGVVDSSGISVRPFDPELLGQPSEPLPTFEEAVSRTERSMSVFDDEVPPSTSRGPSPEALPDLIELPTPLDTPERTNYFDVPPPAAPSEVPVPRPVFTEPQFNRPPLAKPPSYAAVDEAISPHDGAGSLASEGDHSDQGLDTALDTASTNNTSVLDTESTSASNVEDTDGKSLASGFFEQRLPLMQHYSSDTIARQPS